LWRKFHYIKRLHFLVRFTYQTLAIIDSFGSVKGDGRYDQRADITGPEYLVPDGKIDIRDIALITIHFEEIY